MPALKASLFFLQILFGLCCRVSIKIGTIIPSDDPPIVSRNVSSFQCADAINTTVYTAVVQRGYRLLLYREVRHLIQEKVDILMLPKSVQDEMNLQETVSSNIIISPLSSNKYPTTEKDWCMTLLQHQHTGLAITENVTLPPIIKTPVANIVVEVLNNIEDLNEFYFLVEDDYGSYANGIKTLVSNYGKTFIYYQLSNLKTDKSLDKVIRSINSDQKDVSDILVLASLESLQHLLVKLKEFEDQKGNKFTISQQTRWLMIIPDNPESMRSIEESSGYLNNVAVISIPLIDDNLHFSYVSRCHVAKLYTLLWKNFGRKLSLITTINSTDSILNRQVENIFPNNNFGFNQRKLIISSLIYKPFVYRTVVNETNTIYTGFCMDLLHELSTTMNFSYEVVEPPDGEWGDFVNGNWTGIIKEVYTHSADMAVAPLSSTAERRKAIKFSYPYYLEYTTVILQPPDPNDTKWKTFLKPFTYHVLICVAVSLFLGTCILYFIENSNPFYECNTGNDIQSFSDVFWYLYGALLTQGGESLPTSLAGRKFIGFWWLFCIMLVATYSGNLVAFLTISRVEVPFDTLAGMSQQSDYKWGTLGGSAFTTLFLNADESGVYGQIGNGLKKYNKSDQETLSINPEVHYRKVREGKYAYIGDITALTFQAQNCSLFILKEKFYPLHYSIALPQSSNLENAISREIIRMIESGILSLWMKKWWPRTDICASVSTAQAKMITLVDVQSAFYVICIGLALSLLVLLVEVFYKRLSHLIDCKKST